MGRVEEKKNLTIESLCREITISCQGNWFFSLQLRFVISTERLLMYTCTRTTLYSTKTIIIYTIVVVTNLWVRVRHRVNRTSDLSIRHCCCPSSDFILIHDELLSACSIFTVGKYERKRKKTTKNGSLRTGCEWEREREKEREKKKGKKAHARARERLTRTGAHWPAAAVCYLLFVIHARAHIHTLAHWHHSHAYRDIRGRTRAALTDHHRGV